MDDILKHGCMVSSGENSCSGVVLNHKYVLTHSSILRKYLLQHRKQANDVISGKNPIQVPVQVFLENLKHPASASIVHIFKAEKFSEIQRKLFVKDDGWKFHDSLEENDQRNDSGDGNNKVRNHGNHGEELTPEELSILVDFIPYFVLLRLDVPLDQITFRRIALAENIQIGSDVFVVCTPFGSVCPSVFHNSVGSGIVSQCVDGVLILTDAKCAPSTEGAPVFVKQNNRVKLLGLVVAPLFWKNSEWLGLSVVCGISDIIQSLLKSYSNVDNALVSAYSKPSLGVQYTHSPLVYVSPVDTTDKNEFENIPLLDLNLHSRCVVFVQGPGCWGSGVVFDSKHGGIVTCAHVVKNAQKVHVRLHNKQWYSAQVKYRTSTVDENIVYDLAVLMVENWDSCHRQLGIPQVQPAKPVKGAQATVIGHTPFGSGNTLPPMVSHGLVSQVIYREGVPVLFQTSCTVQSGASGGPIFDQFGNLIGIVTSNAKDTETGGCYPHINLVVPVVAVWSYLQHYIKYRDPSVLQNLRVTDYLTRNLWALKSGEKSAEAMSLEKCKL